jgi:hypothetical protein
MFSLVLNAMLLATATRPFDDERLLLDRRLETLRRILPDGANPGADVALVRDLATRTRFASIEAVPRPLLENGPRGEVVVDLTALARFSDVDAFFRLVSSHPRLVDVQSVTLTGTNQEVVKLQAALSLPFRSTRAPIPPTPEGLVERPKGVPKPQADAFVKDQALALAKSEQISALRRSRRNPRVFLAELASATRERPVTLSFASLADEFVIRGLVVGEGPARALETRMEGGFFRVAEFLMARQGACRQFELRGKVPVAGSDAELPLPAEDPFEQDENPCKVERDPPSAAPWARAGGGKTPQGTITVRARDLDTADLFMVLADALHLGFLVDGAVVGRVNAEIIKVGVEDTLAALRKTSLGISETGRIRRVGPGRTVAVTPPEAAGGAAATFTVKRADARDILAVMTELDPTLGALGPSGPLGRVSVFARDQPILDLRSSLLDVVGLVERTNEDGQRLVSRKGDLTTSGSVPVASSVSDVRLVLRPADLTSFEFELQALSTDGGRWTAWAYAPTGHLFPYHAGDRLADGSIKSVDENGVVLESDEGPLKLSLTPAPR